MRDSVDPSTSSPTNDNDITNEEESETRSKKLEVSGGDIDEEDNDNNNDNNNDDGDDNDNNDDDDEEEEDVCWVSCFCNQKGNEFFCQVDDGYLLDDSNLSGLSGQVPCYDYALDLILDVESSHDEFTDEQNDLIEWAAEILYGLIHARYILTSQGMSAMVEKYRSCDFGTCPRFHCNKQRCLPVGESDTPRSRTVKIYCPKCENMYAPESKHQENIDGAYFGTTFPHLFFMNYEHLRPEKATESYVPRIFGFKIRK